MKILTFLLAICMAATIVQAQPASESIWWLNTNKVNTYSPPNNINQPYTFLESDTVRSLGNGLTDVVYHSASNKYYCIASVGGAVTDNAGTLLVFDPATQRFTKRLDFGGARGSNPAALTWGIDENLYGITTAGGANNSGVLFKFTIATQTYTKLMDLPKPAAGWNISFGRTDRGYLRQASTGTFYIVNPYTELSGIDKLDLYVLDPRSNSSVRNNIVLQNDSNGYETFVGAGHIISENGGKFYYVVNKYSAVEGAEQTDFLLKEWIPTSLGGSTRVVYAIPYNDAKSGGSLTDFIFTADKANLFFISGNIAEYIISSGKFSYTATVGSPDVPRFGRYPIIKGSSIFYASIGGDLISYNPTSHAVSLTRQLDPNFTIPNQRAWGITNSNKIFLVNYLSADLPLSIENTGDFSLGSATGNSKTYVDRLGHAPVGMVQAYNGKFYGVTNGGGQFNQGVVFELDPATNSYRKIVDFNKDKDFKVNSNSNPKDFKNLAASSDGKKIYTTYADSLLVAVTIAPAPQVQKPFTFMPPIPPIEGTFNINSLTTVKTSTTEKLCWITQFYPDGDYIYKERWILETYDPATNTRQVFNPLQLYSSENIYITDATDPIKSKLVDSLYREKLGLAPQLTVANGVVYFTTQQRRIKYAVDGGGNTVVKELEVLGTNAVKLNLATGKFAVITTFNHFYDTPTLVNLNNTVYANLAISAGGDFANAPPGQLGLGIYELKNPLGQKLIYDLDFEDYPFKQPVAGNASLWSAAEIENGYTVFVNYNPTTSAKVYKTFLNPQGGDVGGYFDNRTNLAWLPASTALNTPTTITPTSFTVSWTPAGGAVGYAVDVSTDNFATFVAGYEAKAVTGTSLAVTGLQPGTAYQVRVRAVAQQTRSLPSNTVTATTLKQTQTIRWATIPAQTVGNTLALTATAGSGLAVTYSTTTGTKVSIAGNQATLTQAGKATITASQAGNATFSAATPVTQTFCINPVAPTVKVEGNNTASPTLTSDATTGNQWYLNGTAITNATDQTYTALVSGTYTVTVTTEGCTSVASANQPITIYSDLPIPTLTWSNPADIVYGTALSGTQLNASASVQGVSIPGTFTYSPAIETILSAGQGQSLSVIFQPTDRLGYQNASKTVVINVAKANPVISWPTPANVPVGTVLGNAQLNAVAKGVGGATLNGTFSYLPAGGTTLTTAGSATLTANFTPEDAQNYQNASAQVTLTVDRLTPTLTWPTPAAIPYGTPLGDAQLNATANVEGTFTYAPAKGTVLNVGTTTLETIFTPANATNYTTATASTTVEVTKAGQTIAFAAIAPKTVGDADFTVQATASSGLPLVFEFPADKIGLTGNSVRLLSAGFVTLTAKQPGNTNYNPADPVSKSFCISPAKPTITLSNGGSDRVTLTSSVQVGNQWYVNETIINGATAATLAVTTPGVYKVQATVDVCSSAFSDNQAVVVTGDLHVSQDGLQIYPNPVEREIIVRFQPGAGPSVVSVYDVTGRLMASQSPSGNEAQFSVGSYASGTYIVKVQTSDQVAVGRFQKK